MLKSIFGALHDHLAPLNIPVYLEDCVPEGAALPYITADIRPPLSVHNGGSLTLSCWCQGDTANAQRLSQADLLLTRLPARGCPLAMDAGSVILRQEGTAVCIRKSALQGVKMTWKLQFFPAA